MSSESSSLTAHCSLLTAHCSLLTAHLLVPLRVTIVSSQPWSDSEGASDLVPPACGFGYSPSTPGMIAATSDVRSGSGSGRTGSPSSASAMNACQSWVGRLPPVTFFIGELSSLPTHTPVTSSAVKPMNQASRKSWPVPVLPAAGRPSLAPFPVPVSTTLVIRSTIIDLLRLHQQAGAGALALIEHAAVAVADLLDAARPYAVAAIVEGGVGAGQLEERHTAAAERDAWARREVRGDAEPTRRFHHVLAADALGHLHRHAVERFREGLAQADVALVAVLVVAGLPAADADGPVEHAVVGRQAMLESRQEHEGLERRARLAQRLRGAVELAAGIVAPAHHGAHGAVGRERHQRRLAGIALRPVGIEHLRQFGFPDLLQTWIERRHHHEVAVNEADIAGHLIHHPVGEMLAGMAAGGIAGGDLLARGDVGGFLFIEEVG